MKKLAIVAFALVLAMTFVGCGVQDLRFVGTWDYIWPENNSTTINGDLYPLKATRFEFSKDGVVKVYDIAYQYNADASSKTFNRLANTPYEGTWLVINNDILEIEDLIPRYNKKWVVEFSGLKEMKWTDKKNDANTVYLKKATVTKEGDAE